MLCSEMSFFGNFSSLIIITASQRSWPVLFGDWANWPRSCSARLRAFSSNCRHEREIIEHCYVTKYSHIIGNAHISMIYPFFTHQRWLIMETNKYHIITRTRCLDATPTRGMVHIKEPLLLIDKSSLCGGSGFPFTLSEWSLTICLTPYNHR